MMRLSPKDQAAIVKAAEMLVHPVLVDAVRRSRLALTEQGYARGERIDGLVALPALPALPATAIDPPEGTDADDLEDYLSNLLTTLYLPVASPAFTGTLTGPDATLTGTIQAATVSSTGHTNAGNSASDELRVYNLIGQGSAPSLAAGAAMGSSPGSQTITGHDVSGVILQNTGTSTTTGTLWTVTFANAKANANYRVYLAARGSSGAALQLYSTSHTTTTFVIACATAPAGSTQLAISWLVFGP